VTSLLAVHISDGPLNDGWIAGGFAIAAVLVGLGLWRLHEDEVPRIGVITAAFFVASQLHIPGGVTTVHLLLNGLVGVMLGRRAGLAIAVGLTMQFFLFAHGGLSTLGVNTTLMALPAMAAGLVFPFLRRWMRPYAAGFLLGIGAAGATVLGNFAVLVLGTNEDMTRLAQFVLLAHVPVVIIEGLIVGFVVQYLSKVRPEMLRLPAPNQPPGERGMSAPRASP